MIPQPPPGQGPIDPRGAFTPPPPPGGFQPPPPPPHMPPMGPMMMPPPMYMPPPPPPRRGGFWRAAFVTLLVLALGGSLIVNVVLLANLGLSGSGGAMSTSVEQGDPKQKIAHIPISGVIMEEAYERFDRMMKQVEGDSGIKAIVIEIDSPGGSVTASDQIHNRIANYKKMHANVPVVVSMAGLAASGGYYVACPADYIFAQPTTLTGNIGVLMPQYNVSGLFEEWGIKETTVESTGAPFKNAGSMFRPETPEHRAYIQDIADKAFAQFKDVVSQGRTGKGKFDPKKLDQVANGKIYMAADAVANGLIDKVGYLQDAYDYAAQQAKLTRRTIVKYQDPPTLMDVLMSSRANLSSRAGQSIQINGVNIIAGDLREFMTPRLMYLWRGQ